MITRLILRTLCIATILFMVSGGLFGANPATLDSSSFSGAGTRAETILRIPEVGRYSIIAQSRTGAVLELVDRMAGRIASDGQAWGVGSENGRIDEFLEAGEYKLRIYKNANDTVGVSVRAFDVKNAGTDDYDVPELSRLQTVAAELGDLEILSWWIRVEASEPVLILEAEGRNLVDARLWKDGVWDTGIRPFTSSFEPEKGMPRTTIEFNTGLEPGLYLLICSGGPRRAWARETGKDPFTVRRGARYLGGMGTLNTTFGERGIETFLVSGAASYFQMEAGNKKGYSIGIAAGSPGGSRYHFNSSAVINDKSTSYRCAVSGGSSGSQWLILQGPPGESVEVRWFASISQYGEFTAVALDPGRTRKDYLVTALGSKNGEESIDVTGFMLESWTDGKTRMLEPSGIQTLTLSGNKPLRRVVNATSRLSFLLRVESAGNYAVFEKDSKTASARYLVKLLDDAIVRSSVSAAELKAGDRIKLQEKLYIVTILPQKAGILDFAIVPASILGGADSSKVFEGQAGAPANGLFWPGVTAVARTSGSTQFLFGSRESIPLGLSIRELPLDLLEPVCVLVPAGGSVTLPFANKAAVLIASTNPAFTAAAAKIDGAPWRADRTISPGSHALVVSNASKTEAWHVISGVPPERPAGGQRPKRAAIETLFPSFAEGKPAWRDFEREENATYLLKVAEPASYQVATSGRLAMSIRIRTALKPELFSASSNSEGRNAVITSYLRPGTYLVQVGSLGSSRGRAGVELRRIGVARAGTLSEGVVLRSTVAAGSLLKADVNIARDGDYRLECLALGRSFSYRFEDEDGWPIGDPVQSGTLTADLPKGIYHYVSAADQVPTRRLISLERQAEAAASSYDQKAKLMPIEPNRTYRKIWIEAQGRPEDVFTLDLPAPVAATVYVSEGMAFRILDSKGASLGGGQGGTPLPVILPAGASQLRASAIETDNLKEYSLALATADLYEGQPRNAQSLPVQIPVAVGKDGSVEIWSYGGQEMTAGLYDPSGRLVARADAIPDDWNFRIVSELKAGRYVLVISSPDSPAGAPVSAPAAPAVEELYEDEEGYSEEEYSEEEGYYEEGGGEEYSEDGEYYEGEEYIDEEYYEEEPAPIVSSSARVPVPDVYPAASGYPIIWLVSRATLALPAAAGGLDASVDIGSEVAMSTLTARAGEVYRFAARSAEPVSAAVYREGRAIASGPCPLFLPLAQAGAYEVRFWHSGIGKVRVDFKASVERASQATLGAAEQSFDVKDGALKVSNPSGSSFTILGGSGDFLYSGGAELPFAPAADAAVNTAAGTGWIVRADGSPLGRLALLPLVLKAGTAQGFMIGGFDQAYSLDVPSKTAALVTTDNAGEPIGISSTRSYEWRGASVGLLSSVMGLRDGSFRGKLWSADPAPAGTPARRRSVAVDLYPVASETALKKSGKMELTLQPRSAASLTVEGSRQLVRVSLEAGMAAFGWSSGKPTGILDARDAGATGSLEVQGGSITIVNASGKPSLCAIEAGPVSVQTGITEAESFETAAAGDKSLELTVQADRALRLFVWGAFDSASFLSEDDGRIHSGERMSTEMGTILSFPAGKGLLVMAPSGPGALKAWLARPDKMRAAFVAREMWPKSSALPPEGGTLDQSAKSWSFSTDREAIVCLRADTGGVTALMDSGGNVLAVAAGSASRTLLSSVPKGYYSAYTRPLRGAGQSGTLKVQVLSPVVLQADGEGEPVLIGPGDMVLYRFEVKAPGRIGAGVRAQKDGLVASLYDSRLKRMESGALFIRSLVPGTYYMLVESGADTQRFSPVVFGLTGSRTETPEDIIRSYRED